MLKDSRLNYLKEQGALVTAHYNTNSASLRPLIDEFGHEKVQATSCDLTDEQAVSDYFPSISSKFGPVSIIIVNHAIYITEDVPLLNMSVEQWRSTLDINLTSSFLVTREYLRQLKGSSDGVKSQASIMFIGSTAGVSGEAGHADYSATKGGEYNVPLLLCDRLTMKSNDVWFDPDSQE